jgi:hypothetical protein
MFFAALPELFVILVVIFAAWHVVKAFNRLQQPPVPPRQAQRQTSGGRAMIEAEDLASCPVCGTYIAASARHCGRANCPQPR